MTTKQSTGLIDWTETEKEFKSWGKKLQELREHVDVIDQEKIDELVLRYLRLQNEAEQIQERSIEVQSEVKEELIEARNKLDNVELSESVTKNTNKITEPQSTESSVRSNDIKENSSASNGWIELKTSIANACKSLK